MNMISKRLDGCDAIFNFTPLICYQFTRNRIENTLINHSWRLQMINYSKE